MKIEKVGASLIAGEDLFLDAKQEKVLTVGDKGAAFLLARKGQAIPPNYVVRLKIGAEAKGTEPETRSTRPASPELKR